MYVWQRWLADEFRAAGLTVVEVEGWKNRGRPASTGHFNPRAGVTTHHTGARSSATNPRAGLSMLVSGRPDLPGPLCQWATAYDGTVIVVAAGRANHAGRVGRSGTAGMPLGADGNALALGNEVITDGTQPLPKAQRDAIALANKVVLDHYKNGRDRAHRHADISGTGKWDIGQLTTAQLRADIPTTTAAPAVRPTPQEDDVSAEDVWNHPLPTPGGGTQRAKWLLSQAHNRASGARSAATACLEAVNDLASLVGNTSISEKDKHDLAQRIAKRTAEAVARLDAEAVAERLEVGVKGEK